MANKKQPAAPRAGAPPAKQRRVGLSSRVPVGNGKNSHRSNAIVGIASSSATLRPISKRKAKRTGIDVFEASDDDEVERKMFARRSGGGGTLDEVDNYEYHVDEIADEDDEEIDEDEAFGESDEEKYGIFFEGRGGAVAAAGGSDQEDDDDEFEEDEDDEDDDSAYMDISDMLGANSAQPPSTPKIDDSTFRGLLPDRGDEFDDAGMDVDELESDNDDGDDEDEETAGQLSSFVLGLDGKGPRKRKRAVDRTEVYEESEYNLAARRAGDSEDDEDEDGDSKKARRVVGLDALMGSLGDAAGFAGLKKQVAALNKAKGKKIDTVDAPLPKRIQDRVERQAAYAEAKKDLTKWQPLVKKNREAAHLKFPMNEPAAINISSGALVGKFEASSTGMEAEIKKILEEASLLEKSQAKAEELELNKISKEELAERRAELAKMRSLLFFKEQKQKKVAKIKSKAYRKLHRADKDKDKDITADLSIEELRRLDPEAARAEIEKRELKRAEARMSQKHNGKDKWTKKMLDKNNEETHAAQMEKISRGRELRKAITGREDSDSDDESAGGSDAGEGHTEAWRGELDDVEKEIDEAYDDAVQEKGVFAMKFMQRGAARSRKEAHELVQRARDGFEKRDDYRDSDEEADNETQVSSTTGRMTFERKPKKFTSDDFGRSDDETNDVDGFSIRVADPIQVAAASMKTVFPEVSFELEEEVRDASFVGNANRREIQDRAEDEGPTHEVTPIQNKGSVSESQRKSRPRLHEQIAMSSSDEDDIPRKPIQHKNRQQLPAAEDNPWLAGADEVKAVKKRMLGSGVMDANASSISKAEKAIEKHAQMKKAARRAEHDAAVVDVELNMEGVRALETLGEDASSAEVEAEAAKTRAPAKPSQKAKKRAKEATAAATVPTAPAAAASVQLPTYAPSDSDSDFEDGRQNPKMVLASSIKQHLTQRDIMAMAFANDDVAADFAAEKGAEADRDAPKEVDLTLPGWGSWGGIGIKKKTNVVVKKPRRGDGVEKDARKDAKLKHVIINEKRMKKSVKYTTAQVPHGFDNKEQYERTIRAPLGREWNAAGAHTDMIKPRVQTKLGTVIAPLKFAGTGGNKKAGGKKGPAGKGGGKGGKA
ncbi:hypothetical protein HDU87_007215 [Geranomyces variabilis]|uniref:Uncharacterized protein n=1 Tax=Geranomyces variabilis TaxID=109894 RepID=A0AAD5XNE1_9FUNG|nr:hypothetical protein HDU87_007215 [Geranomyces variabilis]